MGPGVCVVSGEGSQVLAPDAASPARWGSDSVALVRAGRIQVRPLGGGAPRTVEPTPDRLVTGTVTFFPGARR